MSRSLVSRFVLCLFLYRSLLLSTGFLFALWMTYFDASSVPVGVREENRCCYLSVGLVGQNARSHRNTVSSQGVNIVISQAAAAWNGMYDSCVVQIRWSNTASLRATANYGLALGLLATSCCKVQAPLSEGRVSSIRSEDVVRALDQQTSEIGVAWASSWEQSPPSEHLLIPFMGSNGHSRA
jgi:hypothetical protein